MLVEFFAPPGQSLTLLLCAQGSYTPANGSGSAATETARAGLYTAAVAEDLTGWHTAHLKAAAWELPAGDVFLRPNSTCRVRDASPSLQRASVTPSSSVDPGWADLYAEVYDEDGELEPDVVCTLRIIREPAGRGQIFGGGATECTSGADGRVCWPKRPVGCQVEYWRGGAELEPKRTKRATIAEDEVVDGVLWLPRLVGL
jgi:hypothetical protein